MEISQSGINYIASEEDYRQHAYWDSNGYAIAFGNHYHPNGNPVRPTDRLDFDKNSNEAKDYIKTHLKQKVYNIIDKSIVTQLNQTQYDALCSFVYNNGNCKILKDHINNRNYDKLMTAWLSVNKYKDEKTKRLVYSESLNNRRNSEYQMFMYGIVNNIPKITTKSRVKFYVESDRNLMNKSLLQDLEKVALSTDTTLHIGTAITGHSSTTTSGNKSRHTSGNAVDIDSISGISYAQNQTLFTQLANSVAKAFENIGYTRNKESGNSKAVLFGFNDKKRGGNHLNHIHASNRLNYVVSSSDDEVEEFVDEKTETVKYQLIENTFENIDTLDKFISAWHISMTPQELLDYVDYDNKISIYRSYNQQQRNKYKQANIECLGVGAIIGVPYDKISTTSVYNINETISENIPHNTFLEREINNIINDPYYSKNSSKPNINEQGTFVNKNDFVQVWLWSKSIDKEGVNFIDITPFVQSINTNVNENGGNFSIKVPNLRLKQKSFNLKKEDFVLNVFDINNDNISNFIHTDILSHLTTFNTHEQKANMSPSDVEMLKSSGFKYYKRHESFFHHYLKNNDMVFIRMEKLISDNRTILKGDDLSISTNNLAGQNLDMIGLIESNPISYRSNNQVDITISGKDISKTLIDDGVYFFDVEYATSDREQIIKNSSSHKSGNRLIIDFADKNSDNYKKQLHSNTGKFIGDTTFNFDKTQSIEEWLTFIFSQLTNIDVCPDNLFNGYKDKSFIITREQSENDSKYVRKLANGIWQICKLAIDPNIGNRRIADQSFTTATGSILNLIRKVCQKPFVDFFMDTYGDKYYFICRKPPFSETAFKTNFCLNIYEQDVLQDNLSFNDNFFTWYKLNPSGSIIDASGGQSLLLLPAVMFPEYMELWGSRVLDVTTQYLDFDMSYSEQSKSNIENIVNQGKQDLDWLIETHAYLPFTRIGTIVIKGDRRFKRGMNIRYMPTGEIYHVDGVTQSREYQTKIGAHTVLHVSRGMVEKHLDVYFNVINLLRTNKNSKDWNKDTWTVNRQNFDFLLNSKQFDNE